MLRLFLRLVELKHPPLNLGLQFLVAETDAHALPSPVPITDRASGRW
jgi:hypothetical protein